MKPAPALTTYIVLSQIISLKQMHMLSSIRVMFWSTRLTYACSYVSLATAKCDRAYRSRKNGKNRMRHRNVYKIEQIQRKSRPKFKIRILSSQTCSCLFTCR